MKINNTPSYTGLDSTATICNTVYYHRMYMRVC